MFEKQEGKNEAVQQDEDKLLVREGEHKEIDNVTELQRENFMTDRGFKVEDDLALCGAHLALPAFTRRKSPLSRKIKKKQQFV